MATKSGPADRPIRSVSSSQYERITRRPSVMKYFLKKNIDFIEYTDLDEYLNDNDFKYKGTFLQFLKDDEPIYIYPPFLLNDVNSNEYNTWYEEQLTINKDLELIKTIYWKLEVISCVLVNFINLLNILEYFN